MSVRPDAATASRSQALPDGTGACPACIRRGWLLAMLSVGLDFRARDLERFWEILALPDRELIEAIGGRRREELHSAYAAFDAGSLDQGAATSTICRHGADYPLALAGHALAPHAMGLSGGLDRLNRILDGPVIAIVGTRRATDHGMETAHALARGLAASGVTVAGGIDEGIAFAAHCGALAANGRTLTVTAGPLNRCSPVCCSNLYRRITAVGCAVSEAPWWARPRHWRLLARARTLALLAHMVIVVEARDTPSELACARLALALGRPLAALPGRVSSPASQGSNALIIDGARLIRDAQDALDVLYGVGERRAPQPSKLAPRLAEIFDEVCGGRDTPAKLTSTGACSTDVRLALTELELLGVLARGDGGRYVPCATPVA